MSYAKKVDANQPMLVLLLRRIPGVSVETLLARCGHGVPDILVGYKGKNYLFEIKDPEKPQSKRKLTSDEVWWHSHWTGQVHVVMTLQDILSVLKIGVKR